MRFSRQTLAFVSGCGVERVPVVMASAAMFFGSREQCAVTFRVVTASSELWIGSEELPAHPLYGEVVVNSRELVSGTATAADLALFEDSAMLISKFAAMEALPREAEEPYWEALDRLSTATRALDTGAR
jgi:hypothetical protein